jgi:hypothetical protein
MAVPVKSAGPGLPSGQARPHPEPSKPWPLRRLPAALLLLLAAATPTLAVGPAAPFEAPRAASPAAAASSSSATGSSTQDLSATAAAQRDPELATLLGVRRSGTTALALIDGRWWPVGSQLRGAQLTHIQAHQVTLRHPDGRLEVLALYSGPSRPAGSTGSAGKALTLLPNLPARTP